MTCVYYCAKLLCTSQGIDKQKKKGEKKKLNANRSSGLLSTTLPCPPTPQSYFGDHSFRPQGAVSEFSVGHGQVRWGLGKANPAVQGPLDEFCEGQGSVGRKLHDVVTTCGLVSWAGCCGSCAPDLGLVVSREV